MLYTSTRGYNTPLSAAEAIKQGPAPDGGLFVPTKIVSFNVEDLVLMQDQSYQQRAVKILKPYLTGFSEDEINESVHQAYNNTKFDHPKIAPLISLDNRLSVLELWHGPTCAFKDMALQLLPHLMVKSMDKTQESSGILILVATSGDTGKAALAGFSGVPNTAILVFYPENGVSEVQKYQMLTQEGANVGVCAVRGNFDDTQSTIKDIFNDRKMQQTIAKLKFKFSSANSINWGRLVPQIVYYFSAYADLLATAQISPGEKINFVVPTGNFGNILAGYYAKKMGLPVHRLICAANENNVLTDFINSGVYDRRRDFMRTISPSMDILISSNLERLLHEITVGDFNRVRKWMYDLIYQGWYAIDNSTREQIKTLFWSDFASDQDTISTIKEIYQKYGYVVDTHTAVGLNVYNKYQEASQDSHYTVALSTASPFKFNSSVAKALLGSEHTADTDEFTLLQMLSDFCKLPIPQSLQELQNRPVLHNTVVNRDEMPEMVQQFAGRQNELC